MTRYIVFDTANNSYVRFEYGGWTSGHKAEEVNSYASFQEAKKTAHLFDSLKNCLIVKVKKKVKIK